VNIYDIGMLTLIAKLTFDTLIQMPTVSRASVGLSHAQQATRDRFRYLNVSFHFGILNIQFA